VAPVVTALHLAVLPHGAVMCSGFGKGASFMSRDFRFLTACVALILLAAPIRTSADPIPIAISAGTLEMTGASGTLSIEGERGFSFSGGVDVVGGVLGPWLTCLPCRPGSPISLGSHWSGSDLRGTAALEGETYLIPRHASGLVDFFGSAGVAPPLEGTLATLVAPFLFEGRFFFPGPEGLPGFSELVVGWGTATVVLGRQVDTPFWSYTSAVYEFDPIPEPGTLLLFGTALAGMALRRRMQR
jgi:hypothetical protein